MARRQSRTDWRLVLVGLLLFVVIQAVGFAVLPKGWTDGWGTGFLSAVAFAAIAGLITALVLNAYDRRHPRQKS